MCSKSIKTDAVFTKTKMNNEGNVNFLAFILKQGGTAKMHMWQNNQHKTQPSGMQKVKHPFPSKRDSFKQGA